MITAAVPHNESERLQALQRLALLDTRREERFDRFVRLARQLLDVPISLVSLVASDRQWFKAESGLGVAQTPRSVSFCAHALHRRGVFYVPDATLDERFHDNPLVTADPHIRFYAGAPLLIDDRLPMGTLCVIDRRPRELDVSQLRALRDLADCAQRELQLQWMVMLRAAANLHNDGELDLDPLRLLSEMLDSQPFAKSLQDECKTHANCESAR